MYQKIGCNGEPVIRPNALTISNCQLKNECMADRQRRGKSKNSICNLKSAICNSHDPVTTDPKGEASFPYWHFQLSIANCQLSIVDDWEVAIRRLLSHQVRSRSLAVSCKLIAVSYHQRQDEDIVYTTRNCGRTYDVGSSHPGGGEAPKGLAVRQ